MNLNITDKLFKYQIPQAINVINIIQDKNICIDGSETGTGKTYVAMAVIKYLNLKPFIICPKTIMSVWRRVAEIFNVEPLAVVNYETVTRGKYYSDPDSDKRENCPYIVKDPSQINRYRWILPINSIIIFDEAHHCSNENTLNGQLLLSLLPIYNENIRILILSATIADNPTKFKSFGYLLKWYANIHWAPEWIRNKDYNPNNASRQINTKLYPEFGSRICIKNLGDEFKKNQKSGELYDLDHRHEVATAYRDILQAYKNIEKKTEVDKKNSYTKILRARQKIELLKLSLFIDLTNEYLENGYSVVIFVNFTDTLLLLANRLKTDCLIYGEQDIHQRHKNINDFMANRKRVIICNILSGSESISLDDQIGNHPRVSLISPTWSSIKLTQAFGRTQRASTKSVALNRIIYCAKTIEERMCAKINEKLRNIEQINDFDLNPYED